jgi:hypothetical protein
MSTLNLKPIKLGKNVELKYVPFSELAVPWNMSIESAAPNHDNHHSQQIGVTTFTGTKTKKPKTSTTLKREDLEALTQSIAQYGLLKPFEVAEMPERLDFFYGGKGKYLIIDGQRRYFAIRDLLKLPTEQDEKTEKSNLQTNSGYSQIDTVEAQAQQQFDQLNIKDYVLIPCLIYPYTTFLQMMRHTTEDKKSNSRSRPTKHDLEAAEKMREQGSQDIAPEDVTPLLETRLKIDEEKQAIQKTLEEIRNRINPYQARTAEAQTQN